MCHAPLHPKDFSCAVPQFEWSINLWTHLSLITIQKLLILFLYTLYLAWFYLLRLNTIHINNHSSACRVDYISPGLWILRLHNLIFSTFHICSQGTKCILDCPISVSLGKKKINKKLQTPSEQTLSYVAVLCM